MKENSLKFADERGLKRFQEELVTNDSIISLREKGGFYYLVSTHRDCYTDSDDENDSPSSPTNLMASQTLQTHDDYIRIPYWALFTFEQNKLHCRAQISFFQLTNKGCNNRKILDELSERIDKILAKVNCTLLVDQLRTTLECSPQLQIGDMAVPASQSALEKPVPVPLGRSSMSRGSAKKATKKFENFSRKALSRTPSSAFPITKEEDGEEEKSASTVTQKEKLAVYKVPMIHQEYFPMPERFKTERHRKNEGYTLLKDCPFLRNFKISNLENSYLAFYEKQIYILVFEETENPFLTKTDRSNSILDPMESFQNPSVSRKSSMKSQTNFLDSKRSFKVQPNSKDFDSEASFPETKTVLLLKIHSLEEANDKAIEHIINQVSEQLTFESIKILAPTFLKYSQLKLSKNDYDFFTVGVPVKVLRYHLPKFVGDYEVFIYYLYQRFKKILYPCSLSFGSTAPTKSQLVENGYCYEETDFSDLVSKKNEQFIDHPKYGRMECFESQLEKPLYFFNHQKKVNEIYLTEPFGKCLFLMQTFLTYFCDSHSSHHIINTLESVFPVDKLPKSGIATMFSYLSSAKNIDQENDAEVRKMLSSPQLDTNMIDKPIIFDKTGRTQQTELTTSANSPSNGEIKFMTPETPNQRLLEFHLRIRGNCFEDKLFAFFTEMMSQTCNDYLMEHLLVYSRKDYTKLAYQEKLKHFVTLLQGIDKTTHQRYESNSIHRSSYAHVIHKNMIFQGFRRIDEIVDQHFQEIFPKERIQDYKVYAIRIARTSTKSSIVLNTDWEVTNFTNNLEELEIEYNKQLNLLKDDPSKHIEIIGLFSEASVCQLNGKQPDPELAPFFEKLKILESGFRNINSENLRFKIPRHVFFQYSLTPTQSKIICYNLVEDLAFKTIKTLKAFYTWSTQRETLYKMIFEDENFTWIDRSKPSNPRPLENNFINELNRCKDHKRMRNEDLLLSKNKALLAYQAEKLLPEKNLTDGGSNLNFTQSVTEILTNFGGLKYFDKLMPFDTIVAKLKQFQLNHIRKYILEFIREKEAEKVSEGEDEIAFRGKYFLQWAEALYARESLLPKMKALMKKVLTVTPEETKKLLNAVLKSSETLIAERASFFTLPYLEQMIFQQSRLAHERDVQGDGPIMDKLRDEEEHEVKYVKYRKAEVRKFTEKLLENPVFKEYGFILSDEEEEMNLSTNNSIDLTKWSSTSLNLASSRKFSTVSDNEKETYELDSEVARKTDRSVIYILVVVFKFFPKPRETEITVSVEWNTTASDKRTKQSVVEKEKAAISSAFSLNTFIYDYQLTALLPLLSPTPNEQIFIDVPQTLFNINASFPEPPEGSTMAMRHFQFVLDLGLLYFNITGESILEHIYEYSEFYGVSSYKNRHFLDMFFAYQATKKLFATEGKNTKVVFLYSKDGFGQRLNQTAKETQSSEMMNAGMTNQMHFLCFIIGEKTFLTEEKFLFLQNTLKETIKEVVNKANEHIFAEGAFRRIDMLEERDIRKSDLHILISHSTYYSLKEIDAEFMKAVTSLPIFGAEFQDYLKSCYRGVGAKVKVIRDPLADERELITSVLVYNGSQRPFLLLEINRSDEIQNVYLVKVFSVMKNLSGKEETEIIKQFKRDIIFQWLCLQNNFLHLRG